jgi:hypothetical protein
MRLPLITHADLRTRHNRDGFCPSGCRGSEARTAAMPFVCRSCAGTRTSRRVSFGRGIFQCCAQSAYGTKQTKSVGARMPTQSGLAEPAFGRFEHR